MPKKPQTALYNLEAEISVLGSILIKPKSFNEIIDFLGADEFWDSKNQLIYETMVGLVEKEEPIDLSYLSLVLQGRGQLGQVGGVTYLSSLTDHLPDSKSIRAYAQKVHDYSSLRRLALAGQQIYEVAQDGHGPDCSSISNPY